MSTDVILPKLNFSMAEGTVAEWMVADGGAVAAGQMLYVPARLSRVVPQLATLRRKIVGRRR